MSDEEREFELKKMRELAEETTRMIARKLSSRPRQPVVHPDSCVEWDNFMAQMPSDVVSRKDLVKLALEDYTIFGVLTPRANAALFKAWLDMNASHASSCCSASPHTLGGTFDALNDSEARESPLPRAVILEFLRVTNEHILEKDNVYDAIHDCIVTECLPSAVPFVENDLHVALSKHLVDWSVTHREDTRKFSPQMLRIIRSIAIRSDYDNLNMRVCKTVMSCMRASGVRQSVDCEVMAFYYLMWMKTNVGRESLDCFRTFCDDLFTLVFRHVDALLNPRTCVRFI